MSKHLELSDPPPALADGESGSAGRRLLAPGALSAEERTRRASSQARRQERVRQVAALLRDRFPRVFCIPRLPLAVGIHQQVLDELGSDVDAKAVRRFLRSWVTRTDYLDAIAHGEPLLNLDGSPAGLPTPDQQQNAAERVYGARAAAVLARIRGRSEGEQAAQIVSMADVLRILDEFRRARRARAARLSRGTLGA